MPQAVACCVSLSFWFIAWTDSLTTSAYCCCLSFRKPFSTRHTRGLYFAPRLKVSSLLHLQPRLAALTAVASLTGKLWRTDESWNRSLRRALWIQHPAWRDATSLTEQVVLEVTLSPGGEMTRKTIWISNAAADHLLYKSMLGSNRITITDLLEQLYPVTLDKLTH